MGETSGVAWTVGLSSVVVAGAVGGGAGAVGRRVLARLRRGARVAFPWCEVSTAALWAVAVARWAAGDTPWWWLPVPLLLGWFGVLLSATDLAHRRLPNALTVPAYVVLGAALGVAAVASGDSGLAWRAAAGTLLFGGPHLAVHLVAPRALGGGDVKLAGSLGGVLGAVSPLALPVGAVLAALVSGLLGVALRAAGRRSGAGRSAAARSVPHGPGMLAAAWLLSVLAVVTPSVPP